MLLKTALAVLWSVNGPVEKVLLRRHSPDAYATVKAFCVSAGYLLARRPVDVAILSNPWAWVLVAVSMLNTPIYARLLRHEDPALALPLVAASSHVLRLAWSHLFLAATPALTARQLAGVVAVVGGGLLLA